MKFSLLEVRVKLWLFFGNIDVVWDGVFCWIVFQIGFYIINSRKNLNINDKNYNIRKGKWIIIEV